MPRSRRPVACLACSGWLFALAAWPAHAAAGSTLVLKNQAYTEITTRGADGKAHKQRVPAAKVAPGSEVVYVIHYLNQGDRPAQKVVVSNPVPAEFSYEAGSETGKNARFEVSVDGGTTYGPLSRLKVAGAGGKSRPAQPADVTHLRWTLATPVEPGKQGSVSYRAVLK